MSQMHNQRWRNLGSDNNGVWREENDVARNGNEEGPVA